VIVSAVEDNRFSASGWNAVTAAGAIRRDGYADRVPSMVAALRASLAPAPADWIDDRLTLAWMAHGHGKSEDAATAWLHETSRLLCDLPFDILARSIDLAIQQSERGFLPQVGQIRAIADERVAARSRVLDRLGAVARALAAPAPEKPKDDGFTLESETAESTADILKRIWPTMAQHQPGYQSGEGKLNLNPERECRKPTRADYVRMGVTPEALDGMGLTE
jgi:hypothetical protein